MTVPKVPNEKLITEEEVAIISSIREQLLKIYKPVTADIVDSDDDYLTVKFILNNNSENEIVLINRKTKQWEI